MLVPGLLFVLSVNLISVVNHVEGCDAKNGNWEVKLKNDYTCDNEKCTDSDGVPLNLANTKRQDRRKIEEIIVQGPDITTQQKIKTSEIQIIKDEVALNGTKRFLADGIAFNSECEAMMKLAEVGCVPGDGYAGNESPHTQNEIFEGVTIGRAALLAYQGKIDVATLQTYLQLSEQGRSLVQSYFHVNSTLYLSFVHLACRRAKHNLKGDSAPLSHAIHADNCYIDKQGGECVFGPPAFTWRDYSAIVYLNNDFDGGEFIFSSDVDAHQIQSKVTPKCGRLVGFHNGAHNLHGVLPVSRGRRCALGLWFTCDVTHKDRELHLAEQMCDQLHFPHGRVSEELVSNLEKLLKKRD